MCNLGGVSRGDLPSHCTRFCLHRGPQRCGRPAEVCAIRAYAVARRRLPDGASGEESGNQAEAG